MIQERSAGAAIFRDNSQDFSSPLFLVVKSGFGHWDIPKGNIEKGEATLDTVRREVAEETGIADLVFMPDFKETIHYIYRRDEQLVTKWVAYFLALTSQEEIKLSFEHQDFAWLPFEEALERLTFKNTKSILLKAENYLKLKRK